MSGENYTASFVVDRAPEVAFDVISDARSWWTGDIEGRTDELGAEWTYRYQTMQYNKLKTTELVPGKRIVWAVIESESNFVEDKHEWVGTEIVFDIAEKDGRTEVRFTHVGLVPDFECYEVCHDAWGFYIRSSIPELITNREA